MAKFVLKDAVVSINGVDLSQWGSAASLEIEVEDQDATTFTSQGWSEVLGGLKSATLGLTFKQDFDAAAVDATLWPIVGEVVPFSVKAKSGATSATNPAYTGNVLIAAYSPVAGEVGNIAEMEVEFPTSGAITRATA